MRLWFNQGGMPLLRFRNGRSVLKAGPERFGSTSGYIMSPQACCRKLDNAKEKACNEAS